MKHTIKHGDGKVNTLPKRVGTEVLINVCLPGQRCCLLIPQLMNERMNQIMKKKCPKVAESLNHKVTSVYIAVCFYFYHAFHLFTL